MAETSSRIIQEIVAASLKGASDADLVALLGKALAEAGLDVPVIEVACDVVDPERDQHIFGWRRDTGAIETSIRAGEVFVAMLESGAAELRLAADRTRFVPVLRDGVTDAVAFATHLEADATIGFFDDVMTLFVTERAGGFAASDIDLLRLVTPVFGLALGARLNAEAARVLLGTYLGRDAAKAMLGGRVDLGAVERMRAIVISCDLVGFTPLTEMLDAQALIDTLNLFFETVTRPLRRVGGQISGHVGDAAIMFLRIPDAESEGARCAAAVEAVRDGLEALHRQAALPSQIGKPVLRGRAGLDVGDVVYGNIGSPGRYSFTIIGTPVNRASRLQALAKELGASVLMPVALAEAAGIESTAYGAHVLRGLDQPVEVVGFGAAET